MAALFVGACQPATGPDLMFYNPDGESDEVTSEASVPGIEVIGQDEQLRNDLDGNDLDGSF
jgi:hypothetical protein